MYPVIIKHKEYAVVINDNGDIRNSYDEDGKLYGKEEVEHKIEEMMRYFYENFRNPTWKYVTLYIIYIVYIYNFIILLILYKY